MKTVFKMGEITIGETKINGIDIEFESTAKDFVELFELGKTEVLKAMKNLPKITEEFKNNMNQATKIAEDDMKDERQKIFKDRKTLIKIGTLLDDAKEQIVSCDGEYDQTTIDAAEGFLIQAEQMYFGLESTTAEYVEEEILDLYRRIEKLQ